MFIIQLHTFFFFLISVNLFSGVRIVSFFCDLSGNIIII
jgi:hypothetical protein